MHTANSYVRRRRLIRAHIAAMDAGEWNRTDAIRRAFWRLLDETRAAEIAKTAKTLGEEEK